MYIYSVIVSMANTTTVVLLLLQQTIVIWHIPTDFKNSFTLAF